MGKGSNSKPSLRGRFLTFEGIDGCGKTTQAKLVGTRLKALGLPILLTREPGGTRIGKRLREVLLSLDSMELEPIPELLLFLADRIQHLRQLIQPAVAQGDIVICDRFHDATVAYQQYARGVSMDLLDRFVQKEVLTSEPDLTFWLDVDVHLASIRRANRKPKEQLDLLDDSIFRPRPQQLALTDELGDKEQLATAIVRRAKLQKGPTSESRLDASDIAFFNRVREGYAAIARGQPQRVIRIAADGAELEVHESIWQELTERFDVA